MTYDHLRKEISRNLSELDEDGRELSDVEATEMLLSVSRAFGLAMNRFWPWEEFTDQEVRDHEGNGEKWEHQLRSILCEYTDRVYLVVTAEEQGPWTIFIFNKAVLINLLNGLPFFEYFIVDEKKSVLVFDTHENQFRIVKRQS